LHVHNTFWSHVNFCKNFSWDWDHIDSVNNLGRVYDIFMILSLSPWPW
jgi:hypothetical protein